VTDSDPVPVRAAGRRKAAAEIMPPFWRGLGDAFPGANGSPCGCGRERCELRLGGSSGGVRKDESLRLVSEGEDGRPSTILGEGSCAPSGDGGPFVGGGRSEEVRGTGGDPDTRPRARAKGEEAGGAESMLDRGDMCTVGGVVGVGAKGWGDGSRGIGAGG